MSLTTDKKCTPPRRNANKFPQERLWRIHAVLPGTFNPGCEIPCHAAEAAIVAYGQRLLETLRQLFHILHQREMMELPVFQKALETARDDMLTVGLDAPEHKPAQNTLALGDSGELGDNTSRALRRLRFLNLVHEDR